MICPHPRHRVHVDAGARGRDVDGRTHALRAGKRLRDAGNEPPVRHGHALLHERGKPADKVDPQRIRRAVERAGKHGVIRRVGGRRDLRNRRDRHALVHDRDAIFGLNRLARAHERLGLGRDLIVELAAGGLRVRIGTVIERNAHGDGPDVEMLLLDHTDGFQYFLLVLHVSLPRAWR